MQKFYATHLNPYLNFHRPCGFAARGKRKRVYKTADYRTPYEQLKSLPGAAKHLKPGIDFDLLDRQSRRLSDTECARKMNAAKQQLLRHCKIESPVCGVKQVKIGRISTDRVFVGGSAGEIGRNNAVLARSGDENLLTKTCIDIDTSVVLNFVRL